MKSYIISLLCLLLAVGTLSAKEKKDFVYLFGVSYSYSDSTVYFTEVIPMEGVELESYNRILPNRQHYAYELKDYMNFKEGKPGRISAIYFSNKKKKVEKTELKLKKRILKKGGSVRYLGDKFTFTRP